MCLTKVDTRRIDETCEALAMASQHDNEAEARVEAARRRIADCDARLTRYRALLDAGTDAALVARWIAEVQGERLWAEAELDACIPAEKLTREQIRALVLALKDITAVLATADPKLKAEVYAELGVNVHYDHERRMVSVTAGPNPCTTERVGEAYSTISTPGLAHRVGRLKHPHPVRC